MSEGQSEGSVGLAHNWSPSQSPEDFVTEARFMIEELPNAKVDEKEPTCFVYLISVEWFEAWKEKVGFQALLRDRQNYGPHCVNMDVQLPVLNQDLLDTEFQKETRTSKYIFSREEQYSLFENILRPGIRQDDHFSVIKESLWKVIHQLYPQAIELKRVNLLKDDEIYAEIEVFWPMVNSFQN